MTENEKLQQIKDTVARFAEHYWHQHLVWQVSQMVLLSRITRQDQEIYPSGDDLINSGEAAEWLTMGKAAVGLIPDTDENKLYVHEICQGVAEWLFSIPGSYTYEIPEHFYQTPFGSLWAAALIWASGDELITIQEAAELAGITVQAVSQSKKIKFYVNPLAPERQGRRLVSKRSVLAIWGE